MNLMAFQTIEAALIATLGAHALGNFVVEGYQAQTHAAEEIHARPHVSVFYSDGDFPKGAGSRSMAQHDMSFRVEIAVAADAKVDLDVLDRESSTPAAKASALAASVTAAHQANLLWNQTFAYVYQILRDPRYLDLGLAMGIIANPWLGQVKKDSSSNIGEFVFLTGSALYTCRAAETTIGATAVPMAGIDISFDETADSTGVSLDGAKQGAEVEA